MFDIADLPDIQSLSFLGNTELEVAAAINEKPLKSEKKNVCTKL